MVLSRYTPPGINDQNSAFESESMSATIIFKAKTTALQPLNGRSAEIITDFELRYVIYSSVMVSSTRMIFAGASLDCLVVGAFDLDSINFN